MNETFLLPKGYNPCKRGHNTFKELKNHAGTVSKERGHDTLSYCRRLQFLLMKLQPSVLIHIYVVLFFRYLTELYFFFDFFKSCNHWEQSQLLIGMRMPKVLKPNSSFAMDCYDKAVTDTYSDVALSQMSL
mgnify:CR=1 FL=1